MIHGYADRARSYGLVAEVAAGRRGSEVGTAPNA
jgi:hypothetical protein